MSKNASVRGNHIAVLILALSVGCSAALAAPNNGVLPDGRAFRTDNNGNQVVDYIAELENQVDVLTKQVYTLEDEVSARGCPDRAAPVAAIPACPACEQRSCPESVITKEVVKNVPDQSCQRELQSAKLAAANQKVDFEVEVAKLNKELAKNLSQQGSVASVSQSCLKENESLKLELTALQGTSDQHNKKLAALEGERDRLVSQLETANNDYNESRKALQAAELSTVNARHALEQQPHKSIAVEVAELPISERTDSRAAVSSATLSATSTLSGARLRAIDSLKGSLASDINRTQSLLSTRDKLFAQNRGRNSGVTLEPAEAKSSNGRNISALRQALANASTGRELSEIKAEVLEIQRKINDDLSAANRMKRLG